MTTDYGLIKHYVGGSFNVEKEIKNSIKNFTQDAIKRLTGILFIAVIPEIHASRHKSCRDLGEAPLTRKSFLTFSFFFAPFLIQKI